MITKQNNLSKLLLIFLSVLLIITSLPLSNVYATEKTNSTSKTEKDTVLGDRADNGGEGSSSTDKYIDSDSNWQPVPGFDISHSGYRMYIINENLQRISPTYDFYFTTPTNIVDKFFDTRFDEGADITYKDVHIYKNIEALEQWCTNNLTTKSWTEVPKPVIGAGGTQGHDSNGTTFKEWFLNGNPNLGTVTEKTYDTIINSSTGNGSTTSTTKKETGDETPEPENKAVVPMTYLTTGTRIVNADYSLSAEELNKYILDKYYGQPLDKVYESIMEGLSAPYKSTYISKVKYYYKECQGSSLEDCKLAAIGDLSRYYKENILSYLYDNTSVNVDGLRDKNVSYDNSSLDNLLQNNIPLAAKGDANGNIEIIGSLEDVIWTEDLANTPAYVLINSDETIQIPEEYGEYPGYAIAKKNCALIVEPIFWIAVKTDERDDTEHTFNGKYYTKGYVYGTLWNLLKYPWKGGHGTYGELLSITMCNSLTINKDYVVKSTGKTIKGVTPKQKYNPLSKAVDSMNNGYGLGLHVYDAEAFKTTSSTQTYDNNLGENIGQAPDPTNLPAESQYPISKNITIIKNYVTVKADGTEQVDGNFIRNQNPHIIQILDEPLYKVVDWQTDNKTTSILTEADNGNTTITYNQLVQNSSKIQSGTTENLVQLSENEFTLYVKLQKQENTPPPSNTRLTSDFILRESELAKATSTNGLIPIQIDYNFPDISLSSSSHNSHTYNERNVVVNGVTQYNADGTVKKTHDDCSGLSSFTDGSITDNQIKVKAKNEEESNYSNIIVQSNISKFSSYINTETLYRNGKSAETKQGNHVYYFTIYRTDNGESTLKLAKYNQKQSSNQDVAVGTTQLISDSNKDIAKTLGYGEANSKTTKTRAEIDYKIPVTFKFIFDTSSPDKSTTFKLNTHTADCGHSEGGGTKSADVTSTTEVISTNDISVQVYSGSPSKQLHTKLWAESTGKNGEKYLQIRDNNNKTVGNI